MAAAWTGTGVLCEADGELTLGINDIGLDGNSGAFQAEVTSRSHA